MNHKTLLALLSIASINYFAQGYEYTFSNHTDTPIEIRVKLLGVQEPWYLLPKIPPNQTRAISWVTTRKPDQLGYEQWRKAGLCLQSIQYRLYSPTNTKTNELVAQPEGAKGAGNPAAQAVDSKGKVAKRPSTAWREADINFVDSQAYNKIMRASEALAEGSADVAQFAAAVGGIKTEKVRGDSLAEGIMGLIGTSTCKDRHFDIAPDKDNPKEISFYSIAK